MSNNIVEVLKNYDAIKFATGAGTDMHNRLARVMIDGENTCGDAALVAKIKTIENLEKLFSPQSRTEVPIAGNINNRFVSRRIDRLYIDNGTQTVYVLDYKTDTNPDVFRERYITQLREYATLLRQMYPKHKVQCLILWTHEWHLENV